MIIADYWLPALRRWLLGLPGGCEGPGHLMGSIFEGALQANEQRELTIDQPGLNAGTYLLRVQSGSLSENLRLTVQH